MEGRERGKMKTVLRCLRADFLKIKNTALFAAHLAIPFVMAGAFLLYYKISPWDSFGKVQAFFQVMGMGYPFLIGVFCAIIAEQELAAGRYQSMLAVTHRGTVFFSKLLLLVLSGGFNPTGGLRQLHAAVHGPALEKPVGLLLAHAVYIHEELLGLPD